MRVLVTGAPGWLGTEVVRRLDAQNHDVRCLTQSGVDTRSLQDYDVDCYPGDLRRQETLHDAYEGGVDAVVHCAGMIHPRPLFGANQFYDINTRGTRNALEAARRHGTDHFVYVSSNAAQGFNDDPRELMTEGMPCRPESDYGRSKYLAEKHVRGYGREHGIDYTIVRPCWYYGPRQPDRMARLMRMIREGNPVMFGDGENLRSMTYVPNLADALERVLDRPRTTKGETYWVADERPYTTNHIYRTIAACLGVEDRFDPRRIPGVVSRACEFVDGVAGKLGIYEQNVHVAGEMRRTIACDPSKAMADLDYQPPSRLEPGMTRSVEWAMENGQV